MKNRIDQTFARLKQRREKALIGYITAGFPTRGSLNQLVPLMEKAGVDLLEIGVPFSDPIADGPMIQHSSQIGLANGATLEWILKSVRTLRDQGLGLPLILMSYCNPIYAMGTDRFFHQAKASGVDGVIVPDLIPEEGKAYAGAAKKHGVDLIYLVAPTTPTSRIRIIARKTRGFLYAVSLTGVTGVRKAMPGDVTAFLKAVRAHSRVPVAVGFGISTPKQARAMAHHADGIIVGSALIREIDKSKGASFKGAVRFIQSLKGALHAS